MRGAKALNHIGGQLSAKKRIRITTAAMNKSAVRNVMNIFFLDVGVLEAISLRNSGTFSSSAASSSTASA